MLIQPIDFIGNLLVECESRPLPATPTDLKPWNRHWSKVLARYGPNPLLNPSHTSVPVRMRISEPADARLQVEYPRIFPIQNMLVRFASYLLHPAEPNDLISKWVGLSRNEKEKCILDVFGGVFGLGRGGDDLLIEDFDRNYSPELTTEYLLADDRALFHLLYLIMKEFQYVSKGGLNLEPVYIPHMGVDWLCNSDDLREAADTFRARRMKLISNFLWKLLLRMNITDERAIITQFGSVNIPARVDPKLPNSVKKLERFLNLGLFCWNCSRRRQKGKKLSECIGCWNVRLSTVYCSKECQENDWTSGDPIPHKIICGRPEQLYQKHDIDALLPPPVSGFKRTPGLEHVIGLMKQHPEWDYIFRTLNRNTTVKWDGPDLQKHRADFLVYRRRAIQTGSKAAVTLMFRMLDFLMVPDKVMRNMIKGQLEGDFGVTIDEVYEDSKEVLLARDVGEQDKVEGYRPTRKEYAIVNAFLEAEGIVVKC